MSSLALVSVFTPLATLILNHLINIPLAIILGFGKYLAFAIALVMDVIQIFIYHNVINHTALGQKYGWKIDSKKLSNFHMPSFLNKFHRSWIYLGVLILSALPIYFGGILSAVITANLMKLNQRKSYFVIAVGSLAGCFIWTIGVWTLFEAIINYTKMLF